MSQTSQHSDALDCGDSAVITTPSWIRTYFAQSLSPAAESRAQDIRRLASNSRAFLSRFLELVFNPDRFAPIIVDNFLLIQSIGTSSGRQLGPDLVYPMLGIKKRQSRSLAMSILEHSRNQQWYELRAKAAFPKGVDPPTVAVINLDEPRQDAFKDGYSTRVDAYGHTSMLVLLEIIGTFIVHVLLQDQGLFAELNDFIGISFGLALCFEGILRGEGTLKLARRSDASARGCAVFLDQDFTVILNGNQGIVEAISEGGFSLSYDHITLIFPFGIMLEAIIQWLACLVLAASNSWFQISAQVGLATSPFILLVYIALYMCFLTWHLPLSRFSWYQLFTGIQSQLSAVVWVDLWYKRVLFAIPLSLFVCHSGIHFLRYFLYSLSSVGHNARNYPIRTAKLLDAIGRPRVRKWQFDTLAAVATFQSLVLCHGIARPIRSIDVLAFLDVLVPDERVLWRVWKERVADRIVHESDISFAPTIPSFADERQRQLVDLLEQARVGYDIYRRFYDRGSIPKQPALDR